MSLSRIQIQVLGQFGVVVDGRGVPADAWTRRTAAHLVKLLALAPDRRLHREQVMDALWPDLDVATAAPRLHTAAHYARRALGDPRAVVLADEGVALAPAAEATIDAVDFEQLATSSLNRGDPQAAAAACDAYTGDLLPADPYEPWTDEPRERLRQLHLDALRLAGRWVSLVQADPTDEEAHRHLMREALAASDHAGALRQFERLDRALRRELGTRPSQAVLQLREQALSRSAGEGGRGSTGREPASSTTPVGRDEDVRRIDRILVEVHGGRGQVLLVSGPRGMGTSTLLLHLEGRAAARGMLVGTGVAAQVAGAWPYAPVMESLSDLCRRHPQVLDRVAGTVRAEIERALVGRELDWNGGSAHQRLYVATAELLRAAADVDGVVLVVDDAHEADEASLRLLHYLARATAGDRVLIVLGHSDAIPAELTRVRASLLARHQARTLVLRPLDREASARLVRQHVDDPAVVEALCAVAGGVPFNLVEMARASGRGDRDPFRTTLPAGSSADALDALASVALLGSVFDTDELVAVSGLSPQSASTVIQDALDGGLLVRAAGGLSFRHGLIRDSLLGRLDVSGRRAAHLRAATALQEADATAARIAHHLLEAGKDREAVPWALRAARTDAALGAYPEALTWLDRVRQSAKGDSLRQLLVLRAELLTECGSPDAVDAHRTALAHAENPKVAAAMRVRLARASLLAGDLDTARFSLEGLEPDGHDEAADADLLMARGHLHLFAGELDEARQDADLAKHRIAITPRSPRAAFDLVAFEGLLAHLQGRWFHRLDAELRRGAAQPEVAAGIFDSHLCVAEYLLYGPSPYEEVMDLAEALRTTARRAGTQRAVAFATALRGEAALLKGDLETAESELTAAVEQHHAIGSTAGEAHSLQRLAEVRLVADDAPEARRLAARALSLARWSTMPACLLPRVYGTQIAAAPDPSVAQATAEQAVAALGLDDRCYFCTIMLDVPAAKALADAGDLVGARRHLAAAEASAVRWQSLGWDASILEARAHLIAAEGDEARAASLLGRAAEMFSQADQQLDALRCLQPPARPAVAGR